MPAPRPREDVERGLIALAIADGSPARAARLLKQEGHPIPETTLKDWLRTKRDEYLEIQARELPKIKQRYAEKRMRLAEKLMDIADETASSLRAELKRGELTTHQKATLLHNANVGRESTPTTPASSVARTSRRPR